MMAKEKFMKRVLILMSLVVASAGIFAEDVDPAYGAWALASEPTKAAIVLTNRTVWVSKNGTWWPSKYNRGYGSPGNFRLIGEEHSPRYSKIGRLDKRDVWIWKRLAELGVNPQDDDIVWWVEEHTDYKTLIHEGNRLVRVSMPDFAAVRSIKDFAGYWKPIKVYGSEGMDRGREIAAPQGVTLKVREDGLVITHFANATISRDHPEPFRIDKFIQLEAGLRYMDMERNDPRWIELGHYRLIFLDEEDCLHFYDWNGHLVCERIEKSFEDPVEERIKMHADGAYHGAWGVNYEFNIMILSFDRGGHGTMMFFAGGLLFDWKVEDGKIVCTFDPDVAALAGCEWKRMTCHYSPDANTMTIDSIDGVDVRFPDIGKAFKLLSKEVQVEEYFKQFEQEKSHPRWEEYLKMAKERKAREKAREKDRWQKSVK